MVAASDSNVDGNRVAASDALELALLQHAQQRELGLGRHLADLIEEDRALVRQLEAPAALLHRARERRLLVAEELRARSASARIGGAVHAHERAVRSPRMPVDRARNQFLAGAGLAQDQHGGIRRRHHGEAA